MLFRSRSPNNGLHPAGEHLGVGGSATAPGRLVYLCGDERQAARPVVGAKPLERWTWHHVAFIRDGDRVRIHLDGAPQPEIEARTSGAAGFEQFFFGGRSDNVDNWEGRLDEIAVFPRPLGPDELARLAAP